VEFPTQSTDGYCPNHVSRKTLTGTFFSSCILYLCKNFGLPVTSKSNKNALKPQNATKETIAVPEKNKVQHWEIALQPMNTKSWVRKAVIANVIWITHSTWFFIWVCRKVSHEWCLLSSKAKSTSLYHKQSTLQRERFWY